jgi:hypothetical protein
MIVKTDRGFEVMSETKGADGKRMRLGGPYSTRAAAEKRLREVEYFKHKKK